ncbi:MAG: hypothetical protein ACKV22_18535 [Bryobacteraceae bacterium]
MNHHEQDPIQGVVGRARRRVMLQEAVAQGMTAACLGLGGAIVILLVGTQLLDWHWLVLLVGGSLVAGAWRLRQRLPEPYRVAQLVDERMCLNDSLSTAWFFSRTEDRRVPQGVLVCQRSMAERLSRDVDVRAAIPFSLPRTAMLFVGLLATTGSLFALRYGVEHRLDVRAPLIQVVFDAFGGRFETRLAKQQGNRPATAETEPPTGVQADDKRFEDEKQLDAAPDKVLDTIEVPDVDNDRLGTGKGDQKGQGKGTGDPRSGEEATEGDPGENPDEGESSSDSTGKEGPNSKNGDEESGGKQAPGGAEENSSLAQKFREAMNNLMSKMKPQSGANMAQAAKSQGGNPQSSIQQKGAGSKGAAEKGQQQGQKGEGEEGEPGESNEGQSSEGASKGKSTENASSQTPGSGMGKQDGSKDLRAAEQMEAMGKISEILGKRSQNVTGEATVEVQSTRQNIRTPYSQNAAVHGQGGGEIHRDEVPESLQHYVQQYFQKVRQQPADTKQPGASPK